MDPSSDDTQQTDELTVLQSIYAEDFIQIPPPKAWKVSDIGSTITTG